MKDNILVNILGLILVGFILNTCVLDKKNEEKLIKEKTELQKLDSVKFLLIKKK